jgi:PKD repeat protein
MNRAIFTVATIILCCGFFSRSYAQAPIAAFAADDTIICPGGTVSFTDLSTPGINPIATWDWNFGDGNTDNIQNTTNTYTSGGTYTVRLIVSDGLGNADTVTHIIYVMQAIIPLSQIRICSPQSTTTLIAQNPNILGVTGTWFTSSSAVIATTGLCKRRT